MPRYIRKVIHIPAECSPNVRYARRQLREGKTPDNTIILPGVMSWADYQKRRATWDDVRQLIGLDAQFPEDSSTLVFPPTWLTHSTRRVIQLKDAKVRRRAKSIGIDPGEGGAKTSMAVGDEYGLIDLVSLPTPDTAQIAEYAIALMAQYQVPPRNCLFDLGGGGKQHADYLRKRGYHVRTIGFGEPPSLEPKRGIRQHEEKVEIRDEKYSYLNRRAEMYWRARILCDPSTGLGYAIPTNTAAFQELHRQLGLIPYTYEGEKIKLPPKYKKGRRRSSDPSQLSLEEIIGHSPDEADAFVLMVHGLVATAVEVVVGAAW